MTATSPLSSGSKSVQRTVRKGRNSFKKQQEDQYYDQDGSSTSSSSQQQPQQRRVGITLPPPVEHSQALHMQQQQAHQPAAVETSSVSDPIKPALQATNTKRRYARRGSKCPSMFMMIRPLIQECTAGGVVASAPPSSSPPGGKQCALSILTEALNLSAADTADLFN